MPNSITYLGTTYEDFNIISGSFVKRESLSITELSVDIAEFTLRTNINLDFFTFEPLPMFTRDRMRFETSESDPLSSDVSQNTPITQSINGGQIAVWYLQSKERIAKHMYKLSAISSLGRLTQKTHYGGIYADALNNNSALAIVTNICGDIPFYMQDNLKTIKLRGWLPIASARDNLRQVLFALNANIRTNEVGVLLIENLPQSTQHQITQSNISDGSTVKYETPVTSVTVLEHQYIAGTETKTLFDGVVVTAEIVTPKGQSVAGQIVTFNEPVSDLQSSALTILESGANYVVLGVGSGTLTGKPYIHITREIRRAVTNAEIENVVRIENATMIDAYAAADVADRLEAYYSCRSVISAATTEYTAKSGDVVKIYDPYSDQMVSACVEENELAISATAKQTIKARIGYVPWQTVEFTDEHVILTGSGTWSVPAGVTNIRAVLIGGGESGGAGYAGGNGGTNYVTVVNSVTVINEPAAQGGVGGVGGLAGDGGKILIIDIDVRSISSFSYATGVGGVGDSRTTKQAGTATTFGPYSSANGAISLSGYTDVDNTVYASPGNAGTKGGNGGNGGNASGEGASGDNGENVGSKTGGTGSIPCVYQSRDGLSTTVTYVGVIGGTGGGGATKNSNGNNATQCSQRHTWNETNRRNDYYLTGTTPSGIDGSSAVSKANSTLYGTGGDGGDGGSGAGGRGSIRNEAWSWSGESSYIHFNITCGTGGAGGNGGTAAPGCIILTYRQPVS